MNTRIPILICIDIEPDGRAIDPHLPVDWFGFEKSFEYFNSLRPQFETATGAPVNFTWFLRMDPQVTHTYGSPDWVVSRYERLIKELNEAGDELGVHTHAWRWNTGLENWVSDFGDSQWVDHCVRSSFDAFHNSFNERCKSFRFGDHWIDDSTVGLLEELGVKFDLTVEPGAAQHLVTGEPFTGRFPDYSRIPRNPYRPSKVDFRKTNSKEERNLWIIPISAGSTALPPALLLRWRSRLASLFNPAARYLSLILSLDPPTFSLIGNRLLRVLNSPYLALPVRTNMLVDPPQRLNLERNIEYLLSHPQVGRFVFETPEAAIKRLH